MLENSSLHSVEYGADHIRGFMLNSNQLHMNFVI